MPVLPHSCIADAEFAKSARELAFSPVRVIGIALAGGIQRTTECGSSLTGCTTTQATGVPMYERHDAPQVDKIPLENGRAPAKWNCDDYGEGWSALVFGLSHTCPQPRGK